MIFHIASTIKELECPFCGSKTSKVHSVYQREIQDLPMQGKKVILLVDTRKMRCMNNTLGGMIGGLMYCAVMKARKRL